MRHRSHKARFASLTGAAVAALALVAASPAHAAEKAIWGPTLLPNGASALPTYAELGVDVLQIQLNWSRVATRRPDDAIDSADLAYRWPSTLDATIAAAATHGIEVALLVRGTPRWAVAAATPGAATETLAPDDPQAFADFLTAASARYAAVRRWMIWGETNSRVQWTASATAYADLLDAAYGALKTLDPTDVVVGGMTFAYGETPPSAWIAAMRRSDGERPRLDELGHNPFTRRCPDLDNDPDLAAPGTRDISDIDTLIQEGRAAFGASTRLWLSEFTVSSDRPSWALDFFVDRAQQADWLAKAFAIAGSVDYVAGIGWFNLLDDGTRVDGLTTGLIAPDGTRKPAFGAYAAARLDGSQPRVPCPPTDTPPASAPPADPLAPDAPPANALAQPRNSAPAGDPDDGRTNAGDSGLAPAPADRRPVELRYAAAVRLRSILRGGYRVGVRCPPGCRIDGSLHVRGVAARRLKLGRRAIRLGSTRAKSRSAGVTNLRIQVGRRNARALRGIRSIPLTLVVTTRHDTRTARLTRSVRLRP